MAQGEAGDSLIRAAVRILRPLARRLIAAGVPFGRLEGAIRELFVSIADSEFGLPNRPQTDSRIALLTGINRKEVKRLRSSSEGRPEPKTFRRNQAASLVSRWLRHPGATDPHGHPKVVPYQAEKGPSFVRFVRETTSDLPPRVILDELVRTGAVELRPGNKVALRAEAYIPLQGAGEKLTMLGEDPPELIETMLFNIFDAEGEPRLQRKVLYDNVGSQAVEKLRRELRREGEQFVLEADRILSRQDRDRNPKAPGGRKTTVGVGIYFFERPTRSEGDDS